MLIKKIKNLINKNNRDINRIKKIVEYINEIENKFNSLSDKSLCAKTKEFKKKIIKGKSINSLLPEAFATVREVSKRVIGMRHFDVQLIGGIALHEGRIAEMNTGEGKTLVSTLPAYLNSLTGYGVHIFTRNNYLANRDSSILKPIYEFLGISVKNITSEQILNEKREAYKADITYGTSNEFCFDYLRDNMIFSIKDKVQRSLNYALIDEVDSILIDEACTPLIISGKIKDNIDIYNIINNIVINIINNKKYFLIDEKNNQIELTENGYLKLEKLIINNNIISKYDSIYSYKNINLIHHVNIALRAYYFFKNNNNYIINDNKIVIIDENTGRTMQDRRWSEGLHQAIEAKEGVKINKENENLTSITFQNFFRMYKKLSGMTGTAQTEAYEFNKIYNLDVLVIPTHKPLIRKDMNDFIFFSKKEKWEAIINDIKEKIAIGRPVLVGTTSIENSEYISNILYIQNIKHNLLNAKKTIIEADIIAQAGKPGVITIATNMAGRGTDIILGGNWKKIIANKILSKKHIVEIKYNWYKDNKSILKSGGLHVIGSERNDLRRIDNQLIGRAGRQGDSGSTRFFLSLEDKILKLFISKSTYNFIKLFIVKHCEINENKIIINAIKNAQKNIEEKKIEIRQELLDYNDIINKQRLIIYYKRNEILKTNNISKYILSILKESIFFFIYKYFYNNINYLEYNDIKNFEIYIKNKLNLNIYFIKLIKYNIFLNKKKIEFIIYNKYKYLYFLKIIFINYKIFKKIILQILDLHWKEHVQFMDQLFNSIYLRSYALKKPKQEYKIEAFNLFNNMLSKIKFDIIFFISNI